MISRVPGFLSNIYPKIAVWTFLAGVFLVPGLSEPTTAQAQPGQPAEQTLLPSNFRVYTQGNTVINHPYPGFTGKVLPTVNEFKGTPGCYVACYSREHSRSIYSVGSGIYVMGQVRVPGRYFDRICRPKGYESADISAELRFKRQCAKSLPKSCQGNHCWAGGDTGGWFGIP